MVATGLSHMASYAYQTGNNDKTQSSGGLSQRLAADSKKQLERSTEQRQAEERKSMQQKPQHEIVQKRESLNDIVQNKLDSVGYSSSGRLASGETRKGQTISVTA